jgi:protein-S-isoprenylcysteine O-methyltransferase Ste14
MPPVYLLAAIAAMVAIHYLFPGKQILDTPWRWVGAVPIVAGVGLVLWVAALFRRRKTTIKPGDISSSLVTDGPFRFSRNPIYVGMTNILVGTAIALGSLMPWLVVPVFVALVGYNVIPVEEAMLAGAFGQSYADYRTKVRRWI